MGKNSARLSFAYLLDFFVPLVRHFFVCDKEKKIFSRYLFFFKWLAYRVIHLDRLQSRVLFSCLFSSPPFFLLYVVHITVCVIYKLSHFSLYLFSFLLFFLLSLSQPLFILLSPFFPLNLYFFVLHPLFFVSPLFS